MMILCSCLITLLVVQNFLFIITLRKRGNLLKQSYHQSEKFRILFDLTVEWLSGNVTGKNISNWIIENGYNTMAIYGMGSLGEILFFSLCKNKNIHIKYGLDQKKSIKIEGLNIYSLEDQLEQVDLVVVTVVTLYEDIKNEISQKTDFPCKVISLLQLVEEMYIKRGER